MCHITRYTSRTNERTKKEYYVTYFFGIHVVWYGGEKDCCRNGYGLFLSLYKVYTPSEHAISDPHTNVLVVEQRFLWAHFIHPYYECVSLVVRNEVYKDIYIGIIKKTLRVTSYKYGYLYVYRIVEVIYWKETWTKLLLSKL